MVSTTHRFSFAGAVLLSITASAYLGCGSLRDRSGGFDPDDASGGGDNGPTGDDGGDLGADPGDAGDGGLFLTGMDSSTPDGSCDFGGAGSFATADNLDLFGQVVLFGDGGALPKGRYQVKYLDGCMKYNGGQGYTVNAFPDGGGNFWLVGDTAEPVKSLVMIPPGTVGWSTSAGAFNGFQDCVNANLALAPKEFDFDGGKLGVWLQDSPYDDNVAGDNGRNPKWRLTLLEGCPSVH